MKEKNKKGRLSLIDEALVQSVPSDPRAEKSAEQSMSSGRTRNEYRVSYPGHHQCREFPFVTFAFFFFVFNYFQQVIKGEIANL